MKAKNKHAESLDALITRMNKDPEFKKGYEKELAKLRNASSRRKRTELRKIAS